jgi:hypothetical protein
MRGVAIPNEPEPGRQRSVQAAGEDSQNLPNVWNVVRVWPLVKVAAQRDDRLAEASHPAEQKAAITAVVGIGGFEDEEQVDRIDRGGPVAVGKVGGAQVAQNAGEDLTRAGRSEHPCVEQDALADGPAEQSLAVVERQQSPAVGRIEQCAVRIADDEVTGEAHAGERHSDATRRLDLDDGEADRQADAALEDAVELAVGRVAELGRGWAAVAELAIEHVVDAFDHALGRIAGVEPESDELGVGVEPIKCGRLVNTRTAMTGHDERGEREVDVRLRPRDEPGKARETPGSGFASWIAGGLHGRIL